MRPLLLLLGALLVAAPAAARQLPDLVVACEDTTQGRTMLADLTARGAITEHSRSSTPLARLEADAAAHPDSIDAQIDLARCYVTTGHSKEAQRTIARALDLLRQEPHEVAGPPLPAGEGETPESLRLGQDVVKPIRLNDVVPIYPLEAEMNGVAGIVFVDVQIAPAGNVRQASIAESVPLLDNAALSAVRQWRYRPTQFNGASVNVHTVVALKFSNQPNPEPTDGLDVARFCYRTKRHAEVQAALNWSLNALRNPGKRQNLTMVDMIVVTGPRPIGQS